MTDLLLEHLKSTAVMLENTFPNGVDKEEYYPLIAILYEELSNRGVARILESVFDVEYSKAMLDVLDAVTKFAPNEEQKNRVIVKLKNFGYDEWLMEE